MVRSHEQETDIYLHVIVLLGEIQSLCSFTFIPHSKHIQTLPELPSRFCVLHYCSTSWLLIHFIMSTAAVPDTSVDDTFLSTKQSFTIHLEPRQIRHLQQLLPAPHITAVSWSCKHSSTIGRSLVSPVRSRSPERSRCL